MRCFFIIFIWSILFSINIFALEVTLTEGSVKPTPIAITDFFSDDETNIKIGKNISTVISNNLERSGLFLPLDNKSFIQDSKSYLINHVLKIGRLLKHNI